MEETAPVRPTSGKSGIDEKVEAEPFGSWMVVERRNGRGQVSGEGKNGSSRSFAGGSRFASLDMNEGGISVVNDAGFAGDFSDSIKASNGGFEGRNLGFEKGNTKLREKQAKTKAKGKQVVVGSGPKDSLRILKPKNRSGRLLSKSNGQSSFDDGSKLIQEAQLDRGKAVVVEPVVNSGTLDKIKHAAVRVLETGKMGNYSSKENGVFRFGNTRVSLEVQEQKKNSISKPKGKPPDKLDERHGPQAVDLHSAMEGIIGELENEKIVSTSHDVQEIMVVEESEGTEVIS